MTSIIHFVPVSGTFNDNPRCYLLKIDEFTFLLDCGCDETCNVEYIAYLKPFIQTIDAVLLSYPDTYHSGALPFLVGKCGLVCDVYATTPVYQMGQMFAYDLYQSRSNYEEFDLFSLDDVDMAFEKVIQVKYNQTIVLKGKGRGIVVMPLPAGHMLGGTMWKIVKDGGEEIIYAVDYNHKKERHLNGCFMEKISRPSLLITDCYNIDYIPERRKKRDEQLFSCITETLRSNGNALISIDTAGRVLELAYMLEHLWRSEPGLQVYSLVLLNNFCYNVIEFSKSLVEWMSDKLMRTFEGQRNNPFAFRHLQLCHNINELSRISEPRVILASQPDMNCGYSRELFFMMHSNPLNTIILTQRSSPGTLSDMLLMNIRDQKQKFSIKLERKTRVPLAGKELEDFIEKKRQEEIENERRKQEEEDLQRKARNSDDGDDDESDEFDYDSESGDGGNNLDSNHSKLKSAKNSEFVWNETSSFSSSVLSNKYDLFISSRLDGRIKGGGFFKNAKKSYPMFPFAERKIKWDEYGEVVNQEDFAIFDVSRSVEDKENIIKDIEMTNGETTSINGSHLDLDSNKSLWSSTMKTVPTKCISVMEDVCVEARIEFIDFEGKSDGESVKRIMKFIRPRRIILIGGQTEKTEAFAKFCRVNDCITTSGEDGSNCIFAPKVMEMVDATTERHIYQVKLKDALVSSLKFSKYKDGAQLAWVDGEVIMSSPESLLPQHEKENGTETINEKDSEEQSDQSRRDLIPVLKQIPLGHYDKPHQTIFVNELKLSDFKQILTRHGIAAEFSGGVLLCNGYVEVKRLESGRIHLEGTVGDDYFKIRKLLYDQYAIL